MFSSLGEIKLLGVEDTLRNLNVKPMWVSSAQACLRLYRIREEFEIRCRTVLCVTFQLNIDH